MDSNEIILINENDHTENITNNEINGSNEINGINEINGTYETNIINLNDNNHNIIDVNNSVEIQQTSTTVEKIETNINHRLLFNNIFNKSNDNSKNLKITFNKNLDYKKNIFNSDECTLTIYQYINKLDLNYLVNDVFYTFWFGFLNNNLIIINQNILNFIFSKNKDKKNFVNKIINKNIKFYKIDQNHNIFKTFNFLNNVYVDKYYLILSNDLKKFLYKKKVIEFQKIKYILDIEKLFIEYQNYTVNKQILNKDKVFLKKQNLIKSYMVGFDIIWNVLKYKQKYIIISRNVLEFLEFNKPCIEYNYKKTYNEKQCIELLEFYNIPFSLIHYNDIRCLENSYCYNFIIKHNKNKKLKNKTWIVLEFKNFKYFLCVLKDINISNPQEKYITIEKLYKMYINDLNHN